MGYGKRGGYRSRNRRSSSNIGGLVGDFASAASTVRPRTALLLGVLGFVGLYFALPWLLTAWAAYNKANMTGQVGAMMGKLLDDVFLRRFIRPAELAGIAVLIVCTGVALWRAAFGSEVSRSSQRDASGVARIIARLID